MAPSEGFFNDGAAYERLMGRWSRRVGDIFIDWIDIPQGLRWIDVGCGTGVFTEEIIRRCAPAAVTAIDPSAEQLAFARERAGLKTVAFHVGDAQALDFRDASFDVAVMALVVHFVPDPAKGIAEMARVVAPAGFGATYVWDYTQGGSPTAPLAAAIKAMNLDTSPPPSGKATSVDMLTQMWRSAGFDAIETRTIRIPVEFANFDECWDSMSVPVGPTGQTIRQMSPESLARLRANLQERLPAAADGRVVFEAVANAIKGRKKA
jgi:ubiquinone/menaquinone biosynthesis C-methylase UbiE